MEVGQAMKPAAEKEAKMYNLTAQLSLTEVTAKGKDKAEAMQTLRAALKNLLGREIVAGDIVSIRGWEMVPRHTNSDAAFISAIAPALAR